MAISMRLCTLFMQLLAASQIVAADFLTSSVEPQSGLGAMLDSDMSASGLEHSKQVIVVFGATGQTGGAVVKHLHPQWHVRAVTRKPEQESAQQLAKQGVEVVQGDLNDPTSLTPHLQDAYGVFSVQDFWEHGFEKEVKMGCTLADLAEQAGVKHFVYSSVEGADRKTGIPHFESKWRVEKHLATMDMPATILRPVFYMENLLKGDLPQQIFNGTLALALDPEKPLQMCAVDDIGQLAAQVFADPATYLGKTLPLAGDELTGMQVAAVLNKVLKRDIEFVELPLEVMQRYSAEMATMFQWYNARGHVATLHDALLPKFMDFETWLRMTGWQDQSIHSQGVDWDRDTEDHSTSQKAPISMANERYAFGEGHLIGKFVAINFINAEPEYRERFESLFRTRAHAVDSLQGFLGMQVLRPQKEADDYLVVTWWDRAEDFNAWRKNPAFLKGHRGFADLKEARKLGKKPPMVSRFSTYEAFAE